MPARRLPTLTSPAAARAACSAMSAARDFAFIAWPPSTTRMSSAIVVKAKMMSQSETEPRSLAGWGRLSGPGRGRARGSRVRISRSAR